MPRAWGESIDHEPPVDEPNLPDDTPKTNAPAAKPAPQAQAPVPMEQAPEPMPLTDSVPYEEPVYYDGSFSEGYYGSYGTYEGGNASLLGLLSRLSVRAEAPLFWRRGIGMPTLLTSSVPPLNANSGGFTDNRRVVLLGDGAIDPNNRIAGDDVQLGGRITLKTWLDNEQYRGLLFRYTNAGRQTDDFRFDSSNSGFLARPYLAANAPLGPPAGLTPATLLLQFAPAFTNGVLTARSRSEVDGFDIVMKRLAYRDRFTRVDWLVGYQHNRIEESLQVNSSSLSLNTLAYQDIAETKNEFNGAVLGLMSTRQFAYWNFEAMFRLGIGSLTRKVDLSGSTFVDGVLTDNEGFLATNTNNQPFKDNTFLVVPEFHVNASYFLTDNMEFLVGYNYLMIPKVAQPGQQFDYRLDDGLATTNFPQLSLQTQKYWMHSLNLGLQWRY